MPRIGGGDIGRARRRVGEPSGERSVRFRAATGEAQGLSDVAGALRDVAKVTGRMEGERKKLADTMAVDNAVNEFFLKRSGKARELEGRGGQNAMGITKDYNDWFSNTSTSIIEGHGLSQEGQARFSRLISGQYRRDIDGMSVRESKETMNAVTETTMQAVKDRADTAYSNPDGAAELVDEAAQILSEYHENPVVGLHFDDDMRSQHFRTAVQDIYTAAVLGKLQADPEAVAEEIKDGKVTFWMRDDATGKSAPEQVKLENVMDAESIDNMKKQARLEKDRWKREQAEAEKQRITATRDEMLDMLYNETLTYGQISKASIPGDMKLKFEKGLKDRQNIRYNESNPGTVSNVWRRIIKNPEGVDEETDILNLIGADGADWLSIQDAQRLVGDLRKEISAGNTQGRFGGQYREVYKDILSTIDGLYKKGGLGKGDEALRNRLTLDASLSEWYAANPTRDPREWSDIMLKSKPLSLLQRSVGWIGFGAGGGKIRPDVPANLADLAAQEEREDFVEAAIAQGATATEAVDLYEELTRANR
jgi:hypothetical protein